MMRCRRYLALIMALIVLTAFSTNRGSLAAEREASFRGKIVYFGNLEDGRHLIETTRLDGTELTTVLDLKESIYFPGRVSPDGRRAAYCTRPAPDQRPQLWLLFPQGKTEKILDEAGLVTDWSPDGKHIAFYWGKSGQWECQVIDVATRRVERVAVPPADPVEVWTPDGSALTVIAGNVDKTFTRQDGEIYPLRALYTAKIDGARLASLTSDPAGDFIWSRYSPDGRRLAYYHRFHRDGKTFESGVVADRDGSKAREIVCFNTLDADTEIRPSGSPCWTPDGSSLLWRVSVRPAKSDDDTTKFIVIPVDGSAVRWLPLSEGRQNWGGIDCR